MEKPQVKQIQNLTKKIALVVDDDPYIITLDRHSTIEISLSLEHTAIKVKRRPRGGLPLHSIYFHEFYQSKLNFDYEGHPETETKFRRG